MTLPTILLKKAANKNKGEKMKAGKTLTRSGAEYIRSDFTNKCYGIVGNSRTCNLCLILKHRKGSLLKDLKVFRYNYQANAFF